MKKCVVFVVVHFSSLISLIYTSLPIQLLDKIIMLSFNLHTTSALALPTEFVE